MSRGGDGEDDVGGVWSAGVQQRASVGGCNSDWSKVKGVQVVVCTGPDNHFLQPPPLHPSVVAATGTSAFHVGLTTSKTTELLPRRPGTHTTTSLFLYRLSRPELFWVGSTLFLHFDKYFVRHAGAPCPCSSPRITPRIALPAHVRFVTA